MQDQQSRPELAPLGNEAILTNFFEFQYNLKSEKNRMANDREHDRLLMLSEFVDHNDALHKI